MENRRPLVERAYDDGVDRWRISEAAPAPALRGHIARYSDYWEETGSFAARRELAATQGVLIFALGAPLEITGADGGVVTVGAGDAFVGGIADATSLSRGLGPQAGIHVFMPLARLAAVCGAPVAELANRVAPFRDLVGRDADDLGGRLCEANHAEGRFERLDRFFARRFADGRAEDRRMSWAMDRLSRGRGSITRAGGGDRLEPQAFHAPLSRCDRLLAGPLPADRAFRTLRRGDHARARGQPGGHRGRMRLCRSASSQPRRSRFRGDDAG